MKLPFAVAVALGLSAAAATGPTEGPALAPERGTQPAPETARSASDVLLSRTFHLTRLSEVDVELSAHCQPCSWDRAGAEAAVLALSVDGRYSQHLPLTQGETEARYRVTLGSLDPGDHRLQISVDRNLSAPGSLTASVDIVRFRFRFDVPASQRFALENAPILYARPDTIGRFSDVPLLMWYETEPTGRGRKLKYSVIFSNEDGGTPSDRLMAVWGRVTDIELVYEVEVDPDDRILEERYQGPGHEMLPFKGRREGTHPLLWVVTDNNMVSDRGTPTIRYRPTPSEWNLTDVSREAVMDANPWTYRVMAQEVAREGRVAPQGNDGKGGPDGKAAKPGSGMIPDPRRFVYVEACGELQDATLSTAIATGGSSAEILDWHDSDAGLPRHRIDRSGCFRTAVALPAPALASDPRGVGGIHGIRGIRFRAFERPPRDGEPPPKEAGRVRLTRINKVFLLDAQYRPGPSLFEWRGSVELTPNGPLLTLPF